MVGVPLKTTPEEGYPVCSWGILVKSTTEGISLMWLLLWPGKPTNSPGKTEIRTKLDERATIHMIFRAFEKNVRDCQCPVTVNAFRPVPIGIKYIRMCIEGAPHSQTSYYHFALM